jgi:hypothetical protein
VHVADLNVWPLKANWDEVFLPPAAVEVKKNRLLRKEDLEGWMNGDLKLKGIARRVSILEGYPLSRRPSGKEVVSNYGTKRSDRTLRGQRYIHNYAAQGVAGDGSSQEATSRERSETSQVRR